MSGVMPLDGVRVLDLTHYAMGPFCTRILGDYGADIVKVERPGQGDPARQLPPFLGDEPGLERSGLFLFLNTNKRSVTIDPRRVAGRELLLRLVERADVLVENFRPGTLERLGLGWETLHAVNPRLVLTRISNFGQDGPYRDWLATDMTVYAMGGSMLTVGDHEHEPLRLSGRVASYHTGMAAALATAGGLLAAEQRGRGELLDISAFETHTHSIDIRLSRLLGYEFSGHVGGRRSLMFGVGSGIFPCADGYFLITSGPVPFPATARMVGMEALLEQPEWATPEARANTDRIAEFEAYLLPWTLSRTKTEIRDACQRFGVMGAPLNTVADLLVDASFVQREFFQTIDHPETGPLRYPGYHFRLHREGEPMPPRRRAPLLGEHTDEVLAELGLEPDVLATLRAEGVIG